MRAVCIIRDGPKFIPVFSIQDDKNNKHVFVWSPIYNAHIWDRGELGAEDSVELERILLRTENFYRASVLLRPSEPANPVLEIPQAKRKAGRPKKVVTT